MRKILLLYLFVTIMVIAMGIPPAMGSADKETLKLLSKYIANAEKDIGRSPLSSANKARVILNFKEAKSLIYKGRYLSSTRFLLDAIGLILRDIEKKIELANRCVKTTPRKARAILANVDRLMFLSGEIHFVVGLCSYVIRSDKVATASFKTILEVYNNSNLATIQRHSRKYLIRIKRRNY